jgi:hypothetical protein
MVIDRSHHLYASLLAEGRLTDFPCMILPRLKHLRAGVWRVLSTSDLKFKAQPARPVAQLQGVRLITLEAMPSCRLPATTDAMPMIGFDHLTEHLPYEWIEQALVAQGVESGRWRRLPAELVLVQGRFAFPFLFDCFVFAAPVDRTASGFWLSASGSGVSDQAGFPDQERSFKRNGGFGDDLERPVASVVRQIFREALEKQRLCALCIVRDA